MSRVRVKVVKKFALNGDIDGHDPIVVRFRIDGPEGRFYLTVVSVNWGRGYSPEQFHENVLRVLDRVDGLEYVVILMQEIDEADPAPEHDYIKSQMEKGTTLVEWYTREPIAVSPGVKVTRKSKVMTMDQGSTIDYKGLGPRRFITSCIITIKGVRIGIATQHPHRYSQQNHRGVAEMLGRGERITRTVLGTLVRVCDLVIDGGDYNTDKYPRSHPKQKIAYQRGLDYIRYILA